MSIAYRTRSRLPLGMWHAHLDRSGVTPSARIFARAVLSPIVSRSGFIRPGGAAELVQRYAEQRGRPGYTRRRIRQLLAELVRAGLVGRAGSAAPGRPATYAALVPGSWPTRPMVVRPRGIQSRRVLAAFRRDLDGQSQRSGP